MQVVVEIPNGLASQFIAAGQNSVHAVLEGALVQAYGESCISGEAIMGSCRGSSL
jgi:hypothetical protein